MSRSFIFLGFLFLGTFSQTLLSAGDSAYWKLPKTAAECFLKHLGKYKSSPSDPLLIYVDACPTVDREQAIISLQKNSAIPQPKQTRDRLTDPVIVYSRAELECLQSVKIDLKPYVILLPKRPCKK